MNLTTAAKLRIPHLYHYQAFNAEYLREIIVGETLHFSKPSDFNDPWDCRPWYDFDAITDPEILEQHVQWYVDISQKHRPHIPIEQVNERASFFEKIRLLWPKKFANSLKLWARQLMLSIEFTA